MESDTESLASATAQRYLDQFSRRHHQTARQILHRLATTPAPCSVRALATHLATGSDATASLTTADRRRVLARVRHVYMPQLEARGLVTTNSPHDTVRLTARGRRVVRALDETTD